MKNIGRTAFLGLCILLSSGIAHAQSYPAKPIKLIVPTTPGGAADTLSRVLGDKLKESMGQPVVVENKAGANGIIGLEAAAKSPNDGYSVLIGMAGAVAINPSLYPKLPYNSLRDFAPIILIARSPLALVVHPSLPVKSVAELIKLAKDKPDELTFASAGPGSIEHLSAELFKSFTSVDIRHIPYKGSVPAITDLVEGRVSMMFENMLSVLPDIKSGRLRALAVLGSSRSSQTPDLPTVAEAGVPGFAVTGWYGIFAPAGTDPAVVKKLNEEINRIIKQPDVAARLSALGLEPAGGTTEEFTSHVKTEIEKWQKVVREAKITIE